MRDWKSGRRDLEARLEAGGRFARGKLVAAADLAPFLEAVLRPGDRVCLEGDNQKQESALSSQIIRQVRMELEEVLQLLKR